MYRNSKLFTLISIIAVCLVSGLPLTANANRVEFILDGSGSMWGRVSGEEKIVAAKRVMKDLITDIELAPEAQLGLVVYGHRKKGDCSDIERFDPVLYPERASLIPLIEKISPKGKTPIAATLLAVGESLKDQEGSTSIVLVSDGIESCDQDPCAIAKQLRDQYGINVTIHVVGFDIKDGREQLECIANAGGGRYFNAADASELTSAFEDVKAELMAADQAPPPPPIEKKVKSFKILKAILTIPNLQERTVAVCTQQAKCDGDFQADWLGELTPDAKSMEVAPGTYKLKFHKYYLEGIEVGAGETVEILVGTLSVPNLSRREVGVCGQTAGCAGDFQAGWAGEVSPEATRLELPAGTYKLKFHKHYSEGIEVEAGETVEILVGTLSVPNLSRREVGVCGQTAKCAGDFQAGWAGEVSPEATRLELPEGTYKLKFHRHYLDGVEITAGQPTEIQISELSMPSLNGESIPVCSPDASCGGNWQDGWVGEISAEAPSLEVPAGEYKIRMGKQFIEGITVAAGEKLVLE